MSALRLEADVVDAVYAYTAWIIRLVLVLTKEGLLLLTPSTEPIGLVA
jgi:hypothetical protein